MGSSQNSLFLEYVVFFKPKGTLEHRNAGMLSTLLLPEGTQLFHVLWLEIDVKQENITYCHSNSLLYKETIPRKLHRLW